jgi:propionaldehyde dehydrogenase
VILTFLLVSFLEVQVLWNIVLFLKERDVIMSKKLGVFETADEAIAASKAAQEKLVLNFGLDDRERFIASIKKNALEHLETLCRMEFEETGYGRYEDKLLKNSGIRNVIGTALIPTRVFATEKGLTIEYQAPFGVIGAVTPVTNPAATILSNGIVMMSGGNTVVFNAHPSAKNCSAYAVQLFNEAVVAEGGPENIVTTLSNPTMGTLNDIMASQTVRLLVGTGGPNMVKTLMGSGKKVIAAGPGNPPSIIDETSDLKKAAAGVLASSSFDNNLLCIAEKELFVVDQIFDEFMKEFEAAGVFILTTNQGKSLRDICLVPSPDGGFSANKKFVGKMARNILAAGNIKVDGDPRIAAYETDFNDPLVHTEQMMPILPVVRCKDFDEAMKMAYTAENGCRHSASIWSNNTARVTAFGKLINTTIFVQNGGTLAAFGKGGSGNDGPTIATPTGEGVCDAATFTRRRRFAMADGANYLL